MSPGKTLVAKDIERPPLKTAFRGATSVTSRAQMPARCAGAVKMVMVGAYGHNGPILSPKTSYAAQARATLCLFGVHFEHKIRCLVRAGVV
jgi:hypothetical protein